MGFNSVYRVLQEVFPQADSRVLRAVAIENSKDADVAVEVVVTEVLPFLSIQSGSKTSSVESISSPNSSEAVENANSAVQTHDALPYANVGNVGVGDKSSNDQILSRKSEDTSKVGSDQSQMDPTLIYENGSNDDPDQSHELSATENVNSSWMCLENSTKEDMDVLNVSSEPFRLNGDLHADMEDLNELLNDLSVHEEQLSLKGNPSELMCSVLQVAPSPVQNCIPNPPDNSLQLVAVPATPVADVEEPEPSGSFIAVSVKDISSSEMVDSENEPVMLATPIMDEEKLELSDSFIDASEKGPSTSEMDDLEGETTMNTILRARSVQICSTELLEDIIENARSEKIALRSAKDSLVSLMKEVELKENSVEQAKDEAAQGGSGILSQVEELKQMLQHAKEANDMNAGEVYAEKAILATEVRELQTRLLSLSDERVRALAILDELRQLLEVRLSEAEKEIKAAEHERLEKEESAQKSLAYEQSVMEKVVQESKILEQQAEENSKLRELLMDRGRLVDMLQGEISVICQDVKLLKEKFDQRVPLNKSLSFSQTACVLVSSTSSSISTAPQQVPELADSPENSKSSATSSTDDQFLCGEDVLSHRKELMDDGGDVLSHCKELIDGEDILRHREELMDDGEDVLRHRKELMDDGWEFFDNHDLRT